MFEEMHKSRPKSPAYTATRNACKLCAPLGATVVFKGIKGCVPMIHGSQGCATYIRRYMISHYKEPVDIASSNFSEETTIFGGNKNFNTSIDNIIDQYHPEAIGIASACLSETIGEDVPRLIHEYVDVNRGKPLPVLVHASTPSYQGSHMDGFHEAVASVVATLAERGEKGKHINLFPGFVSPQDIRHLKDILKTSVWNMYSFLIIPIHSIIQAGMITKLFPTAERPSTKYNALERQGLPSNSVMSLTMEIFAAG
jgi:nitrogenase molybdenum-iron protein NifN